MLLEPSGGERGDLIEGSWFFEEVRCPRDDREMLHAWKLGEGILVEPQDQIVASAHDQQRGRLDLRQRSSRQVGSPASGHDSANGRSEFRRRDQCGRATGAGSEIAKAQLLRRQLLDDPFRGGFESAGQERDVESEMTVASVGGLFWSRQQIEQEGAESGFSNRGGDELVSRTVPTAATAMGEEDNPGGLRR